MAYNNPFMFGGQPIQTPQQVQDQIYNLQQQYNRMSTTPVNTYFSWKYQDNENEIENIQVPANGSPFILVGNGVFYVKQFKNGQSVIQAYSFSPLNKPIDERKIDGSPIPQEKAECCSNDLKSMITAIMERLDRLESKKKQPNKKENPFVEVVDNE